MSGAAARWRDLPGDPGLEPSPHVGPAGRFVGQPWRRAPRRFATEPRLERLLRELSAAFGPQHWWPAETPFEVVVGAVLTQNTAWTNVERALSRLRDAGRLTPARVLALDEPALAALVRPSGTYRQKARGLRAISRWYLEQGGLAALRSRPLGPLRTSLLAVPGVGRETADSVLCYAAGRRTAVVDAYARRLLGRHGLVDGALPYEALRSWLHRHLAPSQRVFEEFHALAVRVGKEACGARARCEACPATAPGDPRVRTA